MLEDVVANARLLNPKPRAKKGREGLGFMGFRVPALLSYS